MKIVYVSDAIYPYNKGGKEKRLYELSTRLAKLGNDVHIYTMHWWKTPEKARMEDGVMLHAISKYYPMYDGDKRSIKEAIIFGLACLKLFTVQFDVLDVDHMPFFPVYSAWIVCALRGQHRQFYGTWHEALSRKDWISYMGFAGNIASVIERVSIHMPYTVTAASAHTQKLIGSELKRTKRVALVGSGIDTKVMDEIKPAKVRCDILYVGRFVKDKNVDMLVEAVAILAQANDGIRCVLIGHGIEKEHLVSLIKSRGLRQQISLLEPQAEAADIYAYMKASKVFCLPSAREGFGIVALEAIGCGTPIVTTNAGANAAKDLIQDSVDGSIVEPEPSQLAIAIDYWLSRPRPKQIKAKAAGYDWGSLAQAQGEVYVT